MALYCDKRVAKRYRALVYCVKFAKFMLRIVDECSLGAKQNNGDMIITIEANGQENGLF